MFSKATSPPEIVFALSEQINKSSSIGSVSDLDSLINYANLTSDELEILEERIQAEMNRKTNY